MSAQLLEHTALLVHMTTRYSEHIAALATAICAAENGARTAGRHDRAATYVAAHVEAAMALDQLQAAVSALTDCASVLEATASDDRPVLKLAPL